MKIGAQIREFIRRIWPVLPYLTYLTILLIIPVGFVIQYGFWSRIGRPGFWKIEPIFTPANYIKAISPRFVESLAFSMGVSLLSATVSLFLGMPVAYFLTRVKGGIGKGFIEISLLFPFFGGIFYAFAMLYAFAPQGLVNFILMNLRLVSEPIVMYHSVESAIIVMMLLGVPTAVLLSRSSIAGVDPVYEEAAIAMGASRFRTFFKITLPLAKSGLIGAHLLMFAGGVGAFQIPQIVAGSFNPWIATHMWRELRGGQMNYPFGAALAVIILIISLVVLFVYLRVTKAE